MESIVPHGPAVAALSQVFEVLWDHLESKSSKHTAASRATIRRLCKGLRDLSYHHITQLSALDLGDSLLDDIHNSEDASDHLEVFVEQQYASVQQLLTKCSRLAKVSVVMYEGGNQLLCRLLNGGHVPRTMESLTLGSKT